MPPRTSARRAASSTAKVETVNVEVSSDSNGRSKTVVASASRKRKADAAPAPAPEPATPAKVAKGKGKAAAAKAKAETEKEEADESALSSLSEDEKEKGATPKSPKKQKKSRARKDTAGGPDDSPFKPVNEDNLADESLPKNTALPETVQFEPRSEGQVRIAAWNITSLKAAADKGMMKYIKAEDADVLVLTETKVNDVPMHPGLTAIYKHQYWGIGTKKGYAGTAILSKVKPISATVGFPAAVVAAADGFSAGQAEPELDTKGRIITLEFDSLYLIGTYAVNAGEGLKSMPAKQHWQRLLAAHTASLDAKKPVIWCGDLNVAATERDLALANKKWNKSPGFTHNECTNHAALLAGTATSTSKPFLDIWRELHPDAVGHYSFFGWRGQCRVKGIGWRLDTFIVSERLRDRVKACEIRYEMYGPSDHIPVFCDIAGPL
ncbi:hypothetical protein OC846_002849 [Tilletia horrida]|uniref:DNA-(apurinic or apyrimidinic site) endonuclease n=1 Tax=Tilletia horrida TaxID=155126 RepID=A0AAN6GQQ2_9BASI|nr:hypothetical protein OC846_002849 [Tilletia horrida]KAK0568647.1 hypothetical protein OC861_001724 [Tilletia horrida]